MQRTTLGSTRLLKQARRLSSEGAFQGSVVGRRRPRRNAVDKRQHPRRPTGPQNVHGRISDSVCIPRKEEAGGRHSRSPLGCLRGRPALRGRPDLARDRGLGTAPHLRPGPAEEPVARSLFAWECDGLSWHGNASYQFRVQASNSSRSLQEVRGRNGTAL